MNILGINGGPNTLNNSYIDSLVHGQFHDSACVLLENGELKFALEEERITRIKHTNFFPKHAIAACLKYNGIEFNAIDYYAFAINKKTLETLGEKYIKNMIIPDPAMMILRDMFKKQTMQSLNLKKVRLYDHHYCHAISAFFNSGFEESLVVTLDGVGEGLSGSVYTGKNNRIELLREFPVEKSLGHLYLEVTEFLGMQMFDEYKVMGLAPYGDPDVYKEIFEEFYGLLPDGNFEINFNKLYLLNTICSKRHSDEGFTQQHKDIAASLQATLETIVFHLLAAVIKETGMTRICFAGGVALNCKLMGELLYSGLFDDIYVFPAAGDNGLSAGAAIACNLELGGTVNKDPLKSLALGIDYTEQEIRSCLEEWEDLVSYEQLTDPWGEAAELLAQGEVLAWFSGREEYGPRALGNRSILADPRPAGNKDRINSIIKMREGFRPFAPAVLEEYVEEFFLLPVNEKKDYPFMSFILKSRDDYKTSLGAVIHADGTARVQTVSKTHNADFWKVIHSFYLKTGTPILLNTSFNNNYEPIVHSPADAITFLLTSDINYLIIDGFLIKKRVLADQGIYVKVIPGEQFNISEDTGIEADEYFLDDVYLKESTRISRELWKLLTSNEPTGFTSDSPLLKEIKDLWRKRTIKVMVSKLSLKLEL